MAFESCIYGYIAEACQNPSGAATPFDEEVLALKAHNESVLNALPVLDDWPPLSRHMFGWAPASENVITYGRRPLHFAAGLKEVDWEIGEWLDKFEDLLRRLYWDRVVLHIEFGQALPRSMTWTTKPGYVHLFKGGLPPVLEWDIETSMSPEELNYRWPTRGAKKSE